MFKTFILLLFLGLFFVANKYDVGPRVFQNTSVETKSIIGQVDLKNFQGDELSVTGPLVGKDVILKKLSCIGPVNLENATIEALDFIGPVDLKNCKITGDATIVGTLTAKNSKFGEITITASYMLLDNAKTRGILVKKNSGSAEKQTLVLTGNTIVDGDISFESGDGFLEKSENVKITGSVNGCSVLNK